VNTARLLLMLSNAPAAANANRLCGLQGKREIVRSQSVPDISAAGMDPEMAVMTTKIVPHGPAAALAAVAGSAPCVTQRPLRATVNLDSSSFDNSMSVSASTSGSMTYVHNLTASAPNNKPVWNADGYVPLSADNGRNALGVAASTIMPNGGATSVAGLRRAMSYPHVFMPSMVATPASASSTATTSAQGDVLMDSLLDGWLVGQQQQQSQHDLVSSANASGGDMLCSIPSS
jgi:hypothetical protein